jgi:hypothetical protein
MDTYFTAAGEQQSRLGIGPGRQCPLGQKRENGREWFCKPGSVSHLLAEEGEATISLGLPLPTASNDLPGNERWGHHHASLFGLSPGGVYPASLVTKAAVRSYRTVSPLPLTCACGGLFSVALSLASRPVAVSNHLDPWSPDFPLLVLAETKRATAAQTTHVRAQSSPCQVNRKGLAAKCERCMYY